MITEGWLSVFHDREFSNRYENGKFVNGKSNILVHSLCAHQLILKMILFHSVIRMKMTGNVFHYQKGNQVINFICQNFWIPVYLKQNNKMEDFSDIPDI